MSTPVLTTKLYIPPPRTARVLRPRLLRRLNEGLHCKLTLISAPAGSGKTTLLSDWIYQTHASTGMQDETGASALHPAPFIPHPDRVAWLSLDEGDNDLTRFLTYLVAAVQTIAATIGAGLSDVLHSPQPPPLESILTALLNDIATIPDHFVLVLDDYHVLDTRPPDTALTFQPCPVSMIWGVFLGSARSSGLSGWASACCAVALIWRLKKRLRLLHSKATIFSLFKLER